MASSSLLQDIYNDHVGLLGASTLTVIGLGAVTYYMSGRQKKLTPPVPLNCQSKILPDGSRVSAYKGLNGEVLTYLHDDVHTLHEAFLRGMRQSNNGPCLGSRTGPNRSYEWLSYKEVFDKGHAFGSGLISKGLKPGTDTFIGIYSKNRTEWLVAERGHNMFSMVTVPIYDTLGTDACIYIINQIDLRTMICDTADKAQQLLDHAARMPTLKLVIMMEEISEKNKLTAEKHGIEIVGFSDVEKLGEKNPVEIVPPKTTDLATLCYTSGTTGDPKGVMLTHYNMINAASAVSFQVKGHVDVTPADRHLSYLPLAHMFERGMQILLFTEGCPIGFSSGDIKLLADDLQTLKPTLFPTVPRLLNRMYDRVQNGVRNSYLKKTLLSWAINSKLVELKNGLIRKNSIWDKLVFNKLQNAMGGHIRLIITGSAPLAPSVLDFCRVAFGCPVLEGYGQTESTAGITFNVPGEFSPGHCGPPLANIRVKLVDVPEMDYYAKNNQGEICAKGPSIFQGYYKNPEKTAEALDSEGWLHTGDIGEWLPIGTLKVIDRKKNLFKLAQGEYIACEKIENVYMRSQFVAQCFVEGNSLQACIMAVVTLDEEYLTNWAKREHSSKSLSELAHDQDMKKIVLKDMLKIGKDGDLKGFEQVKDIYIHPEQFTIENGLLTPTLKNKRPVLRKAFQNKIDQLYSLL